MTPANEHEAHRPGGLSIFFVWKAGLFAAAFWGWLALLAVRDEPLSRWDVIAGAGAVTTTIVGVVLGARHALARGAARRHEQIMRVLVDISWYSFAMTGSGAGAPADESPATPAANGDADVIRLSPDPRTRPRR